MRPGISILWMTDVVITRFGTGRTTVIDSGENNGNLLIQYFPGTWFPEVSGTAREEAILDELHIGSFEEHLR